jgi:hypothetical protein
VKTRQTHPLNDAQREALQARFALRVTARLNEGSQGLPHDIGERLRVAREQALEAARRTRLGTVAVDERAPALATEVAGVSPQGTVTLGGWNEADHARQPSHGRRLDDGPLTWGWRLAATLPVLALLAGLWLVKAYHDQEKADATADIDTAILTDDLPPDAYADPGFEEFLRNDDRTPIRPIDEVIPEADGDLSSTDTEAAEVTP